MKKIILSALIAMACFQPTFAQQQRPERSMKFTPEMMVERMDKTVNLNEEQEKQLLAIYTEMFNERKSSKKATKEERIEQRKKYNQQIKEVLTQEQMETWKKAQKEQSQKRREAMKKYNKNND